MRSMMPLIRRNKTNNPALDDRSTSDAYQGSPSRKGADPGLLLFLLCGILAITFAVTQSVETAKVQNDGIKQTLEDGVILTLEMNRGERHVTLGPHKARVAITKTSCPKPRLWMRVVGEALLSIPLDPENDDTSRWSASFSFPVEGVYQLQARWYGCEEGTKEYTGLPEPISFQVKDGDSEGQLQTSRSYSVALPELFPPGFWASTKKFINRESINAPFVWFSEDKKGALPSATPKLQSETSLGKSTVAEEGNPISKKGFEGLSNYELLCWVGSTSAALTRDAFMSLRPQINAQQRPFKFHFYPLNDFTRPDKDWEGKKGGFRKCKNVLISVDELAADVSQADYKKQVEYFINEVLKCLHDETFPIWVFTVNNPPMVPSQMCNSPSKHTHNHPCNDALFDLFNEKKSNFPPQVRLLDNTDLSDPHFDENLKDIHSAIAMRIFALSANQVDVWRAMDQKGIKDGLMRNGTLEPNVVQEEYAFEAYGGPKTEKTTAEK